jgi:hypothetical protein
MSVRGTSAESWETESGAYIQERRILAKATPGMHANQSNGGIGRLEIDRKLI